MAVPGRLLVLCGYSNRSVARLQPCHARGLKLFKLLLDRQALCCERVSAAGQHCHWCLYTVATYLYPTCTLQYLYPTSPYRSLPVPTLSKTPCPCPSPSVKDWATWTCSCISSASASLLVPFPPTSSTNLNLWLGLAGHSPQIFQSLPPETPAGAAPSAPIVRNPIWNGRDPHSALSATHIHTRTRLNSALCPPSPPGPPISPCPLRRAPLRHEH